MRSCWRISGVDEVIGAFLAAEGVEERADALPGCLGSSLCGFAQEVLELGEHLLDQVEVGRLGRQEQQARADASHRLADGGALVAAQIDGMDAPSRHRCAKVVSFNHHSNGGVHAESLHNRIGSGEERVPGARLGCVGSCAVQEEALPRSRTSVFRRSAGLHGRHGIGRTRSWICASSAPD